MVRGLRAVTVCLAGATLFFGVVFTLEYYHVGSQAFQREELIHKAFQEGNLEPEVPSISPLFFEGKVSGTDGNWGGPDTNRRFGIRKLVVKSPEGKWLFDYVPGSEVHFLFLDAELPGGRLPHVDSRIFQRTWTVTGLSRRGREGVHFKIFSLASYRAFTRPKPETRISICLGSKEGSPAREMDISGVWFSPRYWRPDKRAGPGPGRNSSFPAAVARGGRRSFRSGGNVEIQGSGKCLRVFAEDHVAVNPPAVRVLGHFLGITVKAAWNPASSALEIISGRMKPPG